MAHDRDIIRNKLLLLDGHRISLAVYDFSLDFTRAALTHSCLEEIGQFRDKGDWEGKATLKGYGIPAEAKLAALLANDAEPNSLLYFPRSDSRLSPFVAAGDPAIFFAPKTEGFDRPETKNKIVEFAATLSLADGHEPVVTGKALHCSLAKTPAPLAAGVFVSDPVDLGELIEHDNAADPRVAATVARFTAHLISIAGTGRVTVKVEILSDTVADAFASPNVQYTFPLFVSSAPVGTDVLVTESKSLDVILDGDLLSVPNETQWGAKITVTDTDVDGAVEIAVAGGIYTK